MKRIKQVLSGSVILISAGVVLVWSCCLCASTFASTAPVDDPELEQALQWLRAEAIVFTASKSDQPLYNAPSVVTVYTAEDIEQQGLRSINDILDRTVGYFTTRNAANPLIGNRGIVAGENEPYLLLVDGHNMNSIVDKGPGDYSVFPLLSHVRRVEIIRGPGSTLWGSDAALGVIHIITKDGHDINGLKAVVDYSAEDRQRCVNLQYGEGDGKGHDVMLSATYTQSEGYPEDGFYPDATWRDLGGPPWGPMDKMNDSWELYGKVRHKDLTIAARASDLSDLQLYQSYFAGADKFNRRRHFYLDVGHVKAITRTLSLETKVYADLMERWQQMANPVVSPDANVVDDSFSSKETRYGAELMLRATLINRHQLLAGIHAVRTEVDPVVQSAIHTLPVGAASTSEYVLLAAPDEEDLTAAFYLEDDWALLDNFHLIAGVRVDNNNLRESSNQVLPRFAAIWDIDANWTAKYMFNTGYVRPPVGKSFLAQQPVTQDWFHGQVSVIGVEESEEVQSHDVQLVFQNRRLRGSVTGYYTLFDNAFTFDGSIYNKETDPVMLLYVNADTIKTYGLELDLNYKQNRIIDWYGNYSWTIFSEIEGFKGITEDGLAYDISGKYFATAGKALTQFPHHIWNLGCNLNVDAYRYIPRFTVNLHYRGWTDMRAENIKLPGTYQTLGPEHFVDFNLLFKDVYWKKLDVAFYVKNLFNNDKSRYMLPFSGYWSARRSTIGARLSYTF